jgi:acyl-CoA synthetase (AMP-forming)/AMP-acid ligase II
MARAWGYDRPDLVALAMTPLFHIAAHSWFLPVFANRGTLVIDSYRTERAFELIDRYGVNSFGAVPAMLLMMARHQDRGRYDMSSVTNVRFGASPMPPDKLAEVQALFPNAELFHGMGQTESGGTISVLPGELAFSKAGSTGCPMAGYRVRILDDEGRDLPAGEIGEVVARGPNVMLEYFGQPQETAATLAGGWLRTGDLGYLDEEGCIYLVDRKKDMIIRGGENIYSVEVENVLTQHPSVVQAAVVGLPNPLLGEEVLAFVVTAPGATLDHDELRAFCGLHLAAFKIPAAIRLIDQLPATATGKIQKAELRKLLD